MDDARPYSASALAYGADFIKAVRDEPWWAAGVRRQDHHGHRIMIGQPLEQPAQPTTDTSAPLRDLHPGPKAA